MDSVKNAGDQENSTDILYYGVYTPNENKDYKSVPNVFQDKVEALKVAKKNKKSRFKAFQFYHEAAEFSLNGSEFPNNNTTVNGSLLQKPSVENPLVGEKASPFKGPKPQELVELRKAIEAGNYNFVKDIIWQNPRYLVSSGDTPSILQEGPRYNAMHVAAKSRNPEIAELILNTVSNTEFIKLLYGDDNQQNAEDRTSVLLDLYLNTPNKGLNETPLHFASKHGAADVVEILVSYPQCDKTLINKYNKRADQMICERAELKRDFASVKRKIEILLQDSYYVPVLRAEDRSLPPLIGEPFSPTHPPVLSKDPLSPRLEIHAYAGPMDKKGAQEFRKLWKTPPRSLNFNSPDKRNHNDLANVASLRFKDSEKGLERIGKRLANKYDVNWKEYWPFLGSFTDITSEEGLNLLEHHLGNRYASLNNSIVEESKKSPPNLSDIKEVQSPISDLCAAFSACNLNENESFNDSLDQKSEIETVTYIDKACQVFANRISNDILYTMCNDDQLLQVLETEIKQLELLITSYSDMFYILRNEDNILQVLETEIKQLELLITSYMDDDRFSSVNFQKIHYRLGVLIGQKLYNNVKEEVRTLLFNKIENILELITKSVDCFSSDDESHNCKEQTEQIRKPTIYRKQLICLMRHVLNVLSQTCDTKQIFSEGEVKDWENAKACACVYHARKFKKNSLSRNSSFKNSSKFFSRNDLNNGPRKLCFDEDDGDQNFVWNGINLSKNHNQIDLNIHEGEDGGSGEENKDEENFYTPPSSPSLLIDDVDSESEDEFNDTELPKYDVFIEREYPTKVDCDVYNAINYSEVKLDSKQYPNIYKWHHTISLYTNAERESWQCHKDEQKTKPDSPVSLNNSFNHLDCPKTSTPSKCWLRITGTNSPKAVLKSNGMH